MMEFSIVISIMVESTTIGIVMRSTFGVLLLLLLLLLVHLLLEAAVTVGVARVGWDWKDRSID
jgi:hypothetical protein